MKDSIDRVVDELLDSNVTKKKGKVQEGTWGMPTKMSDVKKVVDIVKQLTAGERDQTIEDLESDLFSLIGDDDLYDELDGIKEEETAMTSAEQLEAAEIIKTRVKDWATNTDEEDWQKPIMHKMIVKLNQELIGG